MSVPTKTPATVEYAGVEVDRSDTVGLGRIQRIVTSPQILLVAVMAAFVLYGATQSDQFLASGTWINILRNAVFIAIIGCFTTFVFVSGGLDLSVGSVFVAGGMATAGVLSGGWPVVPAIAVGLAVGAAAGATNGVLINYAKIPPFITTLGMLYAARSLVSFWTGGRPISPLPESFNRIGQAEIHGLPVLIIYAVVVAVIAHVLLEYATFGWSVRAIGGNREASRNSGINVRRLSTIVYTLSGLSAALAGILMTARLGSGQPSIGNGMELQVISAVIIGGTSLFGGIGTIVGTLLGSLVLSVLTTGLVLLKIDPVLQNFVVGVIIIVAVGLDQVRRTRMFRTHARR